MGRMMQPGTLSTPLAAKIDDDQGLSLSKTADVLMHAFGLRRAQCSLALCWTVCICLARNASIRNRASTVLADPSLHDVHLLRQKKCMHVD
jgi:hypothetical protein